MKLHIHYNKILVIEKQLLEERSFLSLTLLTSRDFSGDLHGELGSGAKKICSDVEKSIRLQQENSSIFNAGFCAETWDVHNITLTPKSLNIMPF